MALAISGSSDNIDFGSASGLDDLSAWTGLLWVYPTTLTSTGVYLSKGASASEVFHVATNGGTTDELWIVRGRASGNAEYTTNSANITTNKWWCIAIVFDTAAGSGEVFNVYVGDLSTPVAEVGYDVAGDGSGAVTTDAANSLRIGNDADGGNQLQGRFGVFQFWNRALTLAEVRQQQLRLHKSDGMQIFSIPGWAGTGTQPDWSGSGNTGTVTGATLADHVPLGPIFGSADDIFTAAAGGGQSGVIGQVTETDTALALAVAKVKAIGQPSESDTAQAFTVHKTRVIGQAAESNTAQPLGAAKAKAIGQAQEADTALPMTVQQSGTIGQAVETDSALPMTVVKSKTIGQAVETDTAQALTASKSKQIGQAVEIDTAFAMSQSGAIVIGQAIETDTALPFTAAKTKTIGQAIENETAQSFNCIMGSGPPPPTGFAMFLASQTATDLAATPIGDNQIRLDWTEPPRACHAWLVELSVNGGVNWYARRLAMAPVSSIVIPGLLPATNYHFRIRAISWGRNRIVRGPLSNNAEATTQPLAAADFVITGTDPDTQWDQAVAAVQRGQIIEIDPSVVLTERTFGPVGGTAGYVTVRSAAHASLPGPHKRIAQADAANMPLFRANTVNKYALASQYSTRWWSFEGIEFAGQLAGVSNNGGCVLLGQNGLGGTWATNDSEVPSDIEFHRCYKHGDATGTELKRGLYSNADRVVVADCLYERLYSGADGQAILTLFGDELSVINTRMEAATENFMAGGGVVNAIQRPPTQLFFDRPDFAKDPNWEANNPLLGHPTSISIKNLFEIKNAHRVWVHAPAFRHDWGLHQQAAIQITPRGESGNMPWVRAENIVIENGYTRDIKYGCNIGAGDNNSVPKRFPGSRDFTLRNMLMRNWRTGGSMFIGTISAAHESRGNLRTTIDIVFDHISVMTEVGSSSGWRMVGLRPHEILGRLLVMNSIINAGQNGCPFGEDVGSSPSYGVNALNSFAGNRWRYKKCAIYGGNSLVRLASVIGPDNWNHGTDFRAEVVDWVGGNFRLKTTSPYAKAGIHFETEKPDNTDIGCNVAQIEALTAHVEDGDWT